MIQYIFGRLFGINRAIGYGLLSRAWSIIGGPITIYMVTTHLDKVTQGRYYTMMSLLGLQVFFEMGLATTLAQFFAHEFSSHSWGRHGRICGTLLGRSRIIDLLRSTLAWFRITSIILTIVLIPVGIWFFKQDTSVELPWKLPWILVVIATSANLMLIPLISLEAGSGAIDRIYRCEAVSAILGGISLWLCFLLGLGLYGLGVSAFIKFFIYIFHFKRNRILLFKEFSKFTRKHSRSNANIRWAKEIWPMQWRMSVSWISGYFIFYLFSPVVYYFHGAKEAGRIGATVAISTALTSISLTWINAHLPMLTRLVAIRDWGKLDSSFRTVLYQTIFAALFGATLGSFLVYLFQENFEFGARFLKYTYVSLFLFAAFIQTIISTLAAYLRAFKKEPFIILAILQAILQGSATLYLGEKYGANAISVSVFSINLFAILPVSIIIWKKCRASWTR